MRVKKKKRTSRGTCPMCGGTGVVRIFLKNGTFVLVPCPRCRGTDAPGRLRTRLLQPRRGWPGGKKPAIGPGHARGGGRLSRRGMLLPLSVIPNREPEPVPVPVRDEVPFPDQSNIPTPRFRRPAMEYSEASESVHLEDETGLEGRDLSLAVDCNIEFRLDEALSQVLEVDEGGQILTAVDGSFEINGTVEPVGENVVPGAGPAGLLENAGDMENPVTAHVEAGEFPVGEDRLGLEGLGPGGLGPAGLGPGGLGQECTGPGWIGPGGLGLAGLGPDWTGLDPLREDRMLDPGPGDII